MKKTILLLLLAVVFLGGCERKSGRVKREEWGTFNPSQIYYEDDYVDGKLDDIKSLFKFNDRLETLENLLFVDNYFAGDEYCTPDAKILKEEAIEFEKVGRTWVYKRQIEIQRIKKLSTIPKYDCNF